MGLKGSVISLLVTAFVMALAWSVMDLPQLEGVSQDFFGKLVISVAILVISKIVSAMLGGGK